jgi:hypothetical protein
MRHISESLFSTPHGSICLTTRSLIKDLNRAGGVSSGVLRDVSNSLWRCAATRPGTIATGQDASGSYYATNSNTTSKIYVALYWWRYTPATLIGSQNR